MHVLALLLPLAASLGFAPQGGPPQPMPRYDVAKEAAFEGTVSEVTMAHEGGHMDEGAHILLKTDGGDVDVRLGPRSFLEQEGLVLAKGDKIKVVGAKVEHPDGAFAIAREVVKEGKTFTLRDKNGMPAWRRGRY